LQIDSAAFSALLAPSSFPDIAAVNAEKLFKEDYIQSLQKMLYLDHISNVHKGPLQERTRGRSLQKSRLFM
jgi:hypothetical protein